MGIYGLSTIINFTPKKHKISKMLYFQVAWHCLKSLYIYPNQQYIVSTDKKTANSCQNIYWLFKDFDIDSLYPCVPLWVVGVRRWELSASAAKFQHSADVALPCLFYWRVWVLSSLSSAELRSPVENRRFHRISWRRQSADRHARRPGKKSKHTVKYFCLVCKV